ncbi:MAG: DUF2723 domain-containing protein [candidate division KSB1 bacterium]|nr:DUF2723 domain-containing protein [candidate division KSB1 bacterium]MDZ7303369.1 DUF2723 domain-containing protein [candidate division KSB1 bacterium]MDZ7312313.1 DUF2723 domain-containing protein [candidate division KSB1 bacterium]
MSHRKLNAVFAGVIFFISFLTYLSTLAPTTSFWDCGEFITCSYILGVPHPPGSPLYILIGRLFTMLPISADIGVRVNLMSPIVSAFTSMFTYLIIIRLILLWKGQPRDWSLPERVALYASGIVGALAFTFSDSQWFNSVEAEVYAAAMFFTAIVIWLILKWMEHAGSPNADRYLLIIVYFMGLAIGVHLLNLLALPTIAMIIFARLYKAQKKDVFQEVIRMSVVAVAGVLTVGIINSGLVKGIPALIKNSPTLVEKLGFWVPDSENFGFWVLGLVMLAVVFFTYWAVKERRRLFALPLITVVLMVLGYSTYTALYIRSGLNPAVDENNPDNPERLVKYLNREQYGDWSITQRRAPLWKYQIEKMYIRYFNWQFLGKGTTLDKEGRIVETYTLRGLWGLPFLLGVIGMFYHFKRDWRRAYPVLTLFVMTGLAIIVYLNQEDPQPRERDYSYTGSFFAFALWIGIGVTAVLDAARKLFASSPAGAIKSVPGRSEKKTSTATSGSENWKPIYGEIILAGLVFLVALLVRLFGAGQLNLQYVAGALLAGLAVFAVLFIPRTAADGTVIERLKSGYGGFAFALAGLLFIFVPVNMFKFNYHEHNRQGNFVAYDYSYNILQSCEPNAIVFTNGDNDTFPLWFLQYVYNIRRDVRVVNLSLLNTDWYIKQLRDDEPRVPINLTDDQIDALQSRPWQTQTISISVPKPIYEQAFADVSRFDSTLIREDNPVVRITVEPTLYLRDPYGQNVPVIRVQDLMILRILEDNKFRRPVYFAVTVSPENKLNLDSYMRMDGLAFKVLPVKLNRRIVNPEIMWANLSEKFKYRNLNNPGVYYDDNTINLLGNYRSAFLTLAQFHLARYEKSKAIQVLNPETRAWEWQNDKDRALQVVQRMDEVMPESVIPTSNVGLTVAIGQMYEQLGHPEELDRRLKMVLTDKSFNLTPSMKIQIADFIESYRHQPAVAESVVQSLVQQDPTFGEGMIWLSGFYARQGGQYARAVEILERWLTRKPDDQQAKLQLQQLRTLAHADSIARATRSSSPTQPTQSDTAGRE